MTNLRIIVLVGFLGGVVGLAIGLPLKYYLVDPYLASLLKAGEKTVEANLRSIEQQTAENVRRDQTVVESLEKLDAQSRKAACEGYISGLKEQGLRASPDIHSACSGS